MLFINALIFTFQFFKDKTYKNLILTESLWAFFLSFFTLYIAHKLEFKAVIKRNPYLRLITVAFVAILAFKFFVKINQGYIKLYNREKPPVITFTTNAGQKIITSDSVIYLGSSKEYLFIYLKNEKKSQVISKTTISLFEKLK
jgi:hypothetical protein